MRRSVTAVRLALGCAVGATTLPAQTGRDGALPDLPRIGFATAIAVAGDEVFVGQSGEAMLLPMPPANAGTVHVFRRSADGAWVEQAALTGADVTIGDGFGQALAVSGDVLAVGAPKQEGARGAVYVFERDAGTWRFAVRLTAGDAAEGDSLGFAVAVEGDVVFAGAPGEGETGAVYVFHREDGGAWMQHHKLGADGATAGDRFGAAVALAGGRALIGAPGPHANLPVFGPPPQFKAGGAYVFRHDHDGGGWVQEARLDGGALVVTAGIAVSLVGDEALVAAPVANGFIGTVLQFRRDPGSGDWREAGRLSVVGLQPPALFGIALARAGSDLLIGAPGARGLSGAVYVFRRDETSGEWSEQQTLSVRTSGFAPFLGMALAGRDGLAVLGAPGDAFFEGTGFVFARGEAGEWRERGPIVSEDAGLDAVAGGQVDCEDGSASVFTCQDVDLVAFVPTRALGGKRGIMMNDIWGWTDPETGNEYALAGRFDAMTFVDVSDPANPVYLGELPMHEGSVGNLWRDVKVYRNHAFIVADGAGAHGVQVFDLTQLRNVTNPPVTFTETAHYDGIFSAHNIVINEETGFAYTVGNSMGGETCGGALHMINIQDPTNPTFAGCHADAETGNAGTGYTHDAQCVIYRGPDAEHAGKEICFNSSETALGIADVTNKDSTVALSRGTYPNVGYTHQGWISDDHRYFYVNDELDEIAGSTARTRTLVWDIEDLDDPVLATEFLGSTGASDHNLYIRGRYMYQSNYVSGLRIIDIADPANPVEVGFFDTVPFGEDAPGFAGSWSNYPYFESGIIIVSSMREGLFILKKRERPPIP